MALTCLAYTAYGLIWRMPLACPELRPAPIGAVADVNVTYGELPPPQVEAISAGPLRQVTTGEARFGLPGVARLLVRGGHEIIIERMAEADDEMVRLLLLGTGAALILHQRGLLPLHASAIVTQAGAVLFMGHSGVGKSTLLNEFLHLDINAVDVSLHAGNRDLFDRVIGLEASELTPAEIERYRPDVYRQLAVEAEEPLFIKVHDRWRHNTNDAPLFPPETTAATLYIVRDPRAVAPSYANHFGVSIDEAIERMSTTDYADAVRDDRLSLQLHQPLGSWSQHVTGWLDQQELPVHLVRYEDLHAAPEENFARILQLSGLPVDQVRLAEALAQSRFDRLQAQEEAVGFRERLGLAPRFFRRGLTDAWREELTSTQIARIEREHGPVMARLGYGVTSGATHTSVIR
jgi:aryl sulfotransferase